jgi:hypothetical protein
LSSIRARHRAAYERAHIDTHHRYSKTSALNNAPAQTQQEHAEPSDLHRNASNTHTHICIRTRARNRNAARARRSTHTPRTKSIIVINLGMLEGEGNMAAIASGI